MLVFWIEEKCGESVEKEETFGVRSQLLADDNVP